MKLGVIGRNELGKGRKKLVPCGVGTEQKNSASPFLAWMSWKANKRLIALALEID
jgi:hypothetical protein